jgi:hypothetical protein
MHRPLLFRAWQLHSVRIFELIGKTNNSACVLAIPPWCAGIISGVQSMLMLLIDHGFDVLCRRKTRELTAACKEAEKIPNHSTDMEHNPNAEMVAVNPYNQATGSGAR